MIRSKLPCFPRAVPLECRGKGEKWVCPRESTEKNWHNNQQSESGGMTKMEENWHDNKPQIANMRMRGEGRKRKEPGAREMLEEWGNSRSKLHRSINQTTVIRSDAPQEKIERDMICGVMQMNRWTKTITLHSNQQWGERIAKTKIPQKWLSCTKTD